MADETPKKGSGSLLEGVVEGPLATCANLVFLGMSLQMCNALTMGIGNALEGPLLSSNLAQMSMPGAASLGVNAIAGPTNNLLSGPAFPTPKGGIFG